MGFTLLQLDSGRGVGSNLCPLQTTSASAGAGTSVSGETVAIESENSIEIGIWKRMIFLREQQYHASRRKGAFAARACYLGCQRRYALKRTAISPTLLPS